MSLPQLDDIPRLAGFLAIAFSASSMVSAVIALFRYKAELDRTVVYLGGEGLMVLSVCRSAPPFHVHFSFSFRSPEEKCHLLITTGIPRLGNRCFHDRYHAILLPRGHRGQPRGCQATIRAIHTLGRRGHTRCPRRNVDHCGHGRTSMTLRVGLGYVNE